MEPAARIQTIPARGMMPSKMEIKSITVSKAPPQVLLVTTVFVTAQ
jgi:hypothetical protein